MLRRYREFWIVDVDKVIIIADHEDGVTQVHRPSRQVACKQENDRRHTPIDGSTQCLLVANYVVNKYAKFFETRNPGRRHTFGHKAKQSIQSLLGLTNAHTGKRHLCAGSQAASTLFLEMMLN